MLDRGPAAFLARLSVLPEHGPPFGWRVVGVDGLPALVQGDVVLRVNGAPLERPEEFMAAWEAVRFATELRVELVRARGLTELRWPIVDAATLIAPSAH